MTVKIIAHTPDPERVIATAASTCYSPDDAQICYDSMSDDDVVRMIRNLRRSGHTSTFEHATFTFDISGVSRVLTHQLVRHRLASYSQQSQRYVQMGGKGVSFEYVEPPSIAALADDDERDAAVEVFDAAMSELDDAYKALVDIGVPKEDARYLLPNACCTNIVVTMNARELLHFFDLRCCNRAQWEIRRLAWEMLDAVKQVAPHVFETAGPGCVRDKCPEGKMSCGKPYPAAELQH